MFKPEYTGCARNTGICKNLRRPVKLAYYCHLNFNNQNSSTKKNAKILPKIFRRGFIKLDFLEGFE